MQGVASRGWTRLGAGLAHFDLFPLLHLLSLAGFDRRTCHGSRAWGGMQTLLRHEVLNHVVSVVVLIRPVVAVVGRADRDLASQIRRAMSSVGLNVAEGFGTQKGNSRLRFETARGSLYEVHAGLTLAVAWGYVSADEIAPIDAALDRLGGRIYGLERR